MVSAGGARSSRNAVEKRASSRFEGIFLESQEPVLAPQSIDVSLAWLRCDERVPVCGPWARQGITLSIGVYLRLLCWLFYSTGCTNVGGELPVKISFASVWY